MLPSTPAEDISNDRQEPCASNSHKWSLIHREKERPQLNPMGSRMNNLQNMNFFLPVKDNIISTIPLHNAQHKAETPIRILALVLASISLGQLPNKLVTLDGGVY